MILIISHNFIKYEIEEKDIPAADSLKPKSALSKSSKLNAVLGISIALEAPALSLLLLLILIDEVVLLAVMSWVYCLGFDDFMIVCRNVLSISLILL